MDGIWRAVLVGLTLAVAGCATPPAVKQLSSAQIGYFDAAQRAVAAQSAALIAAAGKLEALASARIAALEAQSNANLENWLAEHPGATVAERRKNAARALADAAKSARTAAEERTHLRAQVAAIRAKSAALGVYLARMREVQVTLDAYLSSEQAGERVLRTATAQPSVAALLKRLDALVPKVTAGAGELKRLLDALQV